MQLTTPIEPAIAVSTAINTLSNLPQSMDFIEFRVLCRKRGVWSSARMSLAGKQADVASHISPQQAESVTG